MDQPTATLRAGRRSGFMLTCEHAGNALPASVHPTASDRKRLREHWGWDPGAWRLTRALSRRLACPAVGARFSRLWIDPNRHVTDPTLIRREIEGDPLSFNQGLSEPDVLRRMRNCHARFHNEVDAILVRMLHGQDRPWIIAVHSFTPFFEGRPRGFDYGILYDRHRGPAIRLARAMRIRSLAVRYNEPYSGKQGMIYSADRHGRHHDLVCLELEVSQGRLAEPGFAKWLADRLAPCLEEAQGTKA